MQDLPQGELMAAAKVKEDVEKNCSAASTRRRTESPHERRDSPSLQEKPTPNYLRPTISSMPENCRYAKKLSASQSLPTARKPLPTKNYIDKSPLTPKSSSRMPRVSPKPNLEKSKTPKSLRTPPPSSKNRSLSTRKKEANTNTAKAEQEEKVLSIDVEHHHPKVLSPTKVEGSGSDDNEEKKDGYEVHYEGSIESLGGEEVVTSEDSEWGSNRGESRNLKLCQGMEGGKEEGEAKGLVTKRQEGRGKEMLPAYNEVIEETASKLAEKKSKVRALVGAFETVILLQEPESQTSQVSEEKEAKVADEMIQQKPEEEAVGEKSSKLDQEIKKPEVEETNKEGSQRQEDVEEQKSIEKEERKGMVEEGEVVGQETEQQEESGLVIEESKERNEKTESVEEVQRESSNE